MMEEISLFLNQKLMAYSTSTRRAMSEYLDSGYSKSMEIAFCHPPAVNTKEFSSLYACMLHARPLNDHILIVVTPTIVIQTNTSQPLNRGDTVVLVCVAKGVPHPLIQWYKGVVMLKNDSTTFIHNEEFESNGLLYTTSTLGLCSLEKDDIDNYSCQAMNYAGRTSADYEIDIITGTHKFGKLEQI